MPRAPARHAVDGSHSTVSPVRSDTRKVARLRVTEKAKTCVCVYILYMCVREREDLVKLHIFAI